LKNSAQTSLALALAHSRDVSSAADACRAVLALDPRNDRAAALFLLLSSLLQPADDVMELASALKSQLPNNVLVTSVIAGLEVRHHSTPPPPPPSLFLNDILRRRHLGSMSAASFHARI
jgi:hypothetical protein